ncbi:hypothetical protein EMPS_11202 [Entomortierella parvispora]|uniref:Uncharacterized protein n=1 Tax=Entomortierella parvispora TaxID=205924 RepID=A0A9P3HM32_9FUNG|nr:hypothetical protein EMPS_11202 [Entomortierella parvispora]
MRGRLPAAPPPPLPLPLPSPLPLLSAYPNLATSAVSSSCPEQICLQEFELEAEEHLAKVLAFTSAPVPTYTLTLREQKDLLEVTIIVSRDMQKLQSGLAQAGRPPDERDGDYTPAPDWDREFLDALVQQWHEPVCITPDYYLLRSMCLYALGTSIQVSVLGKEHVKRYLSMAMTLAQKALVELQTVIGDNGNDQVLDRYWRYHTIIAYIEQKQAMAIIQEIKDYEQWTGLDASEELYKRAESMVFQAKRSFRRGMRCYPFVPGTESALSKAQDWGNLAAMTESYTNILRDLQDRKAATMQTIQVLEGGLSEDHGPILDYITRISKAHLSLAEWIYDHPEDRPLLVPKRTSLFVDMQRSAVTALHYARRALSLAMNRGLHPRHFCQLIDSLYLMTLVCVTPDLIHAYSREAAKWVKQLGAAFPLHMIDPSYLRASRLMAAKDQAMQALAAT